MVDQHAKPSIHLDKADAAVFQGALNDTNRRSAVTIDERYVAMRGGREICPRLAIVGLFLGLTRNGL